MIHRPITPLNMPNGVLESSCNVIFDASSADLPVRSDARRMLIRFRQPNLSVLEVSEQIAISLSPHVARPNNRGTVDIGFVINPFVMHIVAGQISDDD